MLTAVLWRSHAFAARLVVAVRYPLPHAASFLAATTRQLIAY